MAEEDTAPILRESFSEEDNLEDKGDSDNQSFSGASATNGERNERLEPRNDGRAGASTEKTDYPKPPLPKLIFFGNGMLADFVLESLRDKFDIIFHARTKDDLKKVIELKAEFPEAHGILASFGVMIKSDVLEAFEPEGILNLHPSLLPEYRGASPIESAILAGDTNFSYSIMKLVKSMDAGPIYHQATLENLPLDKKTIYQTLATAGSEWIAENLEHLPEPTAQNDSEATFCGKLNKSMSFLKPDKSPAQEIFRQIVAYQGFPKPKYEFYGKTCIILESHVLRVTDILCEAAGIDPESSPLMLKCADRNFVVIDRLQPEGKKPMDAKSFLNGYKR